MARTDTPTQMPVAGDREVLERRKTGSKAESISRSWILGFLDTWVLEPRGRRKVLAIKSQRVCSSRCSVPGGTPLFPEAWTGLGQKCWLMLPEAQRKEREDSAAPCWSQLSRLLLSAQERGFIHPLALDLPLKTEPVRPGSAPYLSSGCSWVTHLCSLKCGVGWDRVEVSGTRMGSENLS